MAGTPESNAELPVNVAVLIAHQFSNLKGTPDYFAGRDSELWWLPQSELQFNPVDGR